MATSLGPDWSCAGEAPRWHFLREAVRYVTYEDGAPLRLSPERFSGLVPLWQTLELTSDHPSEVACPVGEALLVVLDFLLSSIQRMKLMQDIQLDGVLRAFAVLEAHDVPVSGVIRSSWPLLGFLAVAQRHILGLGGSKHGSLGILRPYAALCDAAKPLAVAVEGWMDESARTTLLPPLSGVAVAAARFRRHLAEGPEACNRDRVGPAVSWLLHSLAIENTSSASLPTGFDKAIDGALAKVGWTQLFFTGWPVFAMLHRIQETYFRDAFCAEAEPGAYGLLSRAVPESVWICVRRRAEVVDDRWRQEGEFPDCGHVLEAMQGESRDCLVVDIGANYGACALGLAKLGFEVLALEPTPLTARLLRAAVARNGLGNSVVVLEAAAGHGGATPAFVRCPRGHSARCQVSHEAQLPGEEMSPTAVQSISLDTAVEEHLKTRRLCAVKIDVEGAELETLLSGVGVLSGLRPTLFLELHPFELRAGGSSTEEVFDLLVDTMGYRAFQPLPPTSSGVCPPHMVRGNGTWLDARWLSAEPLDTLSAVADSCACALACTARIAPWWQPRGHGCRCWDFEESSGRCGLWRRCGLATVAATGAPEASPEHRGPGPKAGRGSAPAAAAAGWLAGELNGNWRVTA